jgi:predicted ferric reductase
MTWIKKSWRGLLFVVVLLSLNSYLWWTATPVIPQPVDSVLSQLLGGLILTLFFLVFLLSTRQNWLVQWFGGMDRMYAYHRWLAILPLVLILLHEELSEAIIEVLDVTSPILGEANDAGETAQTWFLVLIGVALLAKYLKYEHWRFIHRLMIIPFIYGSFHAFYSSTYALFSGSALSIFMIIIVAGGMASSAYMVFMYQWVAFHYRGKVTNITYPNADTIDVEITLNKPLRYQPGQFVFLKIFQRGLEDAPHPFSVSGSNDRKVYFTIKKLGDFTKQLHQKLHLATSVSLTRAFGTMTLLRQGPKQIWIAGGIGLTPFLAHLRQPEPLLQNVTLYYSYRNAEDAIGLDVIQAYANTHPNFTLIPHSTKERGHLSLKHISLDKDAEVFLCGPRMMVKSLVKQIKKNNPSQRIDYEAFTFMGTLVEDVFRYGKKILQLFIQ